MSARRFDVAGIGLNATDTILTVPCLPRYGGKASYTREILSPGGQVASALVACQKLGLRTTYIGTVGDDERARVQIESLRDAGVDLQYLQVRTGCANQSAYILVDGQTGERTVFWRRDDCLRIDPEQITPEQITCARLLHVDGHDTAAVEHGARLARQAGIPVTVDVDTIYPGFDRVLPYVDYLIASSEFPGRWTGEKDPFRALQMIQDEYGMKVASMTLGDRGALARAGGSFYYSPAFAVECVDTTGAGDIFHGAFCYGVLQGFSLERTLELSNALAALNCTAMGARGGVRSAAEAEELIAQGERRVDSDFASRCVSV